MLARRLPIAGVEVDLVARRAGALACVEVKTARHPHPGTRWRPADALRPAQVRRLWRAADALSRRAGVETRVVLVEVNFFPGASEPVVEACALARPHRP